MNEYQESWDSTKPLHAPVKRVRKVSNDRNTDGVLCAYTRVNVCNIFGQHVSKRVSLGTDWNTTLEAARDLVQKARESNSVEIQAEYRINL